MYTISTVLVELQAVIGREKPLLVSFLNQTLQFCRLFGRLTTQGAMPVENAMFVSKVSCPPVPNLVVTILNKFSLLISI